MTKNHYDDTAEIKIYYFNGIFIGSFGTRVGTGTLCVYRSLMFFNVRQTNRGCVGGGVPLDHHRHASTEYRISRTLPTAENLLHKKYYYYIIFYKQPMYNACRILSRIFVRKGFTRQPASSENPRNAISSVLVYRIWPFAADTKAPPWQTDSRCGWRRVRGVLVSFKTNPVIWWSRIDGGGYFKPKSAHRIYITRII